MTTCSVCGKPSQRGRVIRRGTDSHKCNTCHSKQNVLRRMCGQWPTRDFAMLPGHTQQEFMAKISDATSAQIASFLEEIQSHEHHDENYSDGGAYLPLSVWAQKGWDPAQIESTVADSDILEDKRFGKLYRVAVLYKGVAGGRGFERKGKLQVRSATKNPAAVQPSGAPAAIHRSFKSEPPASDTSGARSSSSSSSSASSSSDRKKSKKRKNDKQSRASSSSERKNKHHKKSKKCKTDKHVKGDKKHKKNGKHSSGSKRQALPPVETPMEKKARELQQKHAIQQKKNDKKFCTTIINKLQPILDAAMAIKNGGSFEELPRSLAGVLSDLCRGLTSDIGAAKDVLSDGEEPMPFENATVSQRTNSTRRPVLGLKNRRQAVHRWIATKHAFCWACSRAQKQRLTA